MLGRMILSLLLMIAIPKNVQAFALGMELGPLLQLVAGQVEEIRMLTETLGVAKDQAKLLVALNDGIERAIRQIEAIQDIVERARGLDPRAIRSLADLNALLSEANGIKADIDELLKIRFKLINQAIAEGALQGENAYKTGQELVKTGSDLNEESGNASPGRASQITASASSAQMVAQGVELQTLSQILQLQALQLDLQKAQLERDQELERLRKSAFEKEVIRSLPKPGGRP